MSRTTRCASSLTCTRMMLTSRAPGPRGGVWKKLKADPEQSVGRCVPRPACFRNLDLESLGAVGSTRLTTCFDDGRHFGAARFVCILEIARLYDRLIGW